MGCIFLLHDFCISFLLTRVAANSIKRFVLPFGLYQCKILTYCTPYTSNYVSERLRIFEAEILNVTYLTLKRPRGVKWTLPPIDFSDLKFEAFK